MPNIMKLLPQKLWWYPGETRNDSCSKIIFCSYSFLLTCLIKALETTYLLETDWLFSADLLINMINFVGHEDIVRK